MFHSHHLPFSKSVGLLCMYTSFFQFYFTFLKNYQAVFKTKLFFHSFFFFYNYPSFKFLITFDTHQFYWLKFPSCFEVCSLLLAYTDYIVYLMDRITSILWSPMTLVEIQKTLLFLCFFFFGGNMQALKTQNYTDTLDLNKIHLRTVVINS